MFTANQYAPAGTLDMECRGFSIHPLLSSRVRGYSGRSDKDLHCVTDLSRRNSPCRTPKTMLTTYSAAITSIRAGSQGYGGK